MRIGRPKNINKRENRRFHIHLTVHAVMILKYLRENRKNFDASQYFSERLEMDFGKDMEYALIKFDVAENTKIIDALYRKNEELSKRAQTIMDKKIHQSI